MAAAAVDSQQRNVLKEAFFILIRFSSECCFAPLVIAARRVKKRTTLID